MQVNVINSGKVEGSRGLTVFGVQGEGVGVDEASGDIGVVLIRLGEAVVWAFAIGTNEVIESQADAADRVAVLVTGEVKGVVGFGLALTLYGEEELHCGVIEVNLGGQGG